MGSIRSSVNPCMSMMDPRSRSSSHGINACSLTAPRQVPCRRKKTTPCLSNICFASRSSFSPFSGSIGGIDFINCSMRAEFSSSLVSMSSSLSALRGSCG